MTIDEFNSAAWCSGMKAIYKSGVYRIVSCDFDEHLVALDGVVLGEDEPSWVRCENIQIVEAA